jgi:uncharacterized protein (DUF433 family)
MASSLATPHFLKTTEVAVVAGVDVREVDRVIDEKVLPKDLFNVSRGRARELSPIACLFIAFYYATAKLLTADARRGLIGRIRSDLLESSIHDITQELLSRNWTIDVTTDHLITLNLDSIVRRTVHGASLLEEACSRITSSPEVMGGADVIDGTRIMVRDLAEAVNAGRPFADILEDYEHPTLTERDVELAAIYAKAYPVRGRPPLEKALAKKGYRRLRSSKKIHGRNAGNEVPDR